MLKLFLEFGPLGVFLVTYKYSDIFMATRMMLGITVLCLSMSYLIDKKISVPLLISGGLFLLSGGVTLISGDAKYIKMKPTIMYFIFSMILHIGVFYQRPFLRDVLGNMFKIKDYHWLILSRRFGYYFLLMAVINELVWRSFSEDFWVNFKVFGAIPITVIFVSLQLPFLYKHQHPK